MKLGETLQSLGRPVAYFPELARFLGNVPAAVLLAQLIYWKGRTAHNYLYTTNAKISEETGLTVAEQRKARALLVGMDIIDVKLARLQHELHITVDDARLSVLWSQWLRSNKRQRPRRSGMIRDAKGRIIGFTKSEKPGGGHTINGTSGRSINGTPRSSINGTSIPKTSPKTSPKRPPIPLAGGVGDRGKYRDTPRLRATPFETPKEKEGRLEKRRRLLDGQARQLMAAAGGVR